MEGKCFVNTSFSVSIQFRHTRGFVFSLSPPASLREGRGEGGEGHKVFPPIGIKLSEQSVQMGVPTQSMGTRRIAAAAIGLLHRA